MGRGLRTPPYSRPVGCKNRAGAVSMENITLIVMPGSGKSNLGALFC